jgi:hypothetical protein
VGTGRLFYILCGHGLQIRAIVHKRLSCKSERSGFGYFDGEINSQFFSEGVAMDVFFNGYVTVAGLKYEKGKLYHIQIVEPNTN